MLQHVTNGDRHLGGTEHNLLDLRMSLPKDAMIGLDCGTSRHAAMEAAEQGADYVGFRQESQTGGEPLVKWWTALAQIPAVPLDAVDGEAAMILSKEADFLRPSDAMWENTATATRIISKLGKPLA